MKNMRIQDFKYYRLIYRYSAWELSIVFSLYSFIFYFSLNTIRTISSLAAEVLEHPIIHIEEGCVNRAINTQISADEMTLNLP